MRKFIDRKGVDTDSTKALDPMNATERSVFFKKEQIQECRSINSQLENEFNRDNFTHAKTDSLEPHVTTDVKQSSDDNVVSEHSEHSDMVKKLFDESLSAVKEFNDEKMKLVYKQLESEKQLTKQLNDKLQVNLSKISEIDRFLERKKDQLQIELDEKTQNLIQAEKLTSIGELSARLAHDMKNPLTMIKNTIQLLRTREGQQMDEYVMKRFDLLDESIFRINHQIDGVLDYVRQTPLERKSESLLNIIKLAKRPIDVPDNVMINLPTKDIHLNCDVIKMEVVFGNLLLNAIQAIKDKPGQIYVRYVEQPNNIFIEIADSGPGIPLQNTTKIFDPLFTTKQEGTGLGLTSCKSIIEQHGGKIELKSNKPTVFLITLPK